jgi:hypothetical protein
VFRSRGFVLNPYDHFVANNVLNGSQCTIVLYVDDFNVDSNVVINIIEKVSYEFDSW